MPSSSVFIGSYCSLTMIGQEHHQFGIDLQTLSDEAVSDIINQVYPNQ